MVWKGHLTTIGPCFNNLARATASRFATSDIITLGMNIYSAAVTVFRRPKKNGQHISGCSEIQRFTIQAGGIISDPGYCS
jgi:hypothetical protein